VSQPPPAASFDREIFEQPDVLARQLEEGRETALAIAREVCAFAPRWIAIAARGSSDNAARYAQYLFGAHNRLAVSLAAPSLFTVYDAPPSLEGALVLAVSQSGRSPDVIAVIEEARRQGALTVAVTNDPGSPLAQAAARCLPILAGEERAVAATKTYTAELMALATLSAAMEQATSRWDELGAVPALVREALRTRDAAARAAADLVRAERFLVIGRGFNYATAFEIALKIKETSYVLAEPYSSADLRHGPAALVDAGLSVVVVAPSGKVAGDVAALLDLFEERGARVIAISNLEPVLSRAHAPLPIPDVPEWLSPMIAVVPGQLFALALATARGLDPDRPRGLSKITPTR
jgi:glutamine---fructose-6-phosphate transaminase (isomerizing)